MADDVSKVVPFLSVRTVKLATLSVSPETLSESLVAQIPEETLFAADGALNGRICFARKLGKPVFVISPDGTVTRFELALAT